MKTAKKKSAKSANSKPQKSSRGSLGQTPALPAPIDPPPTPAPPDDTRRAHLVREMVLSGAAEDDVLAYFQKGGWDPDLVPQFVDQAKSSILAGIPDAGNLELAKSLTRLGRLYGKAYAIQDYRVCLSIQREINNLFRLNKQPDNEIDDELWPMPGILARLCQES